MEVSAFDSDRALAKAANVAPNTVRNLLDPDSRAPNQRGQVSLRLDILQKVARALGYKAWQLQQENFDPLNRPSLVLNTDEAEWYRKAKKLYLDLPQPPTVPEP